MHCSTVSKTERMSVNKDKCSNSPRWEALQNTAFRLITPFYGALLQSLYSKSKIIALAVKGYNVSWLHDLLKNTPWYWTASATWASVLCARTDAHQLSTHTAFHWNHKLPESSSPDSQVQWDHSQSNFQHVGLEFVEIQVNSIKAFLWKASSYP